MGNGEHGTSTPLALASCIWGSSSHPFYFSLILITPHCSTGSSARQTIDFHGHFSLRAKSKALGDQEEDAHGLQWALAEILSGPHIPILYFLYAADVSYYQVQIWSHWLGNMLLPVR